MLTKLVGPIRATFASPSRSVFSIAPAGLFTSVNKGAAIFAPDSASKTIPLGKQIRARSHRDNLIARRFWWPDLEREVREYVLACLVCNRNKASNSPTAGLLQPLPVPSRPWSHISLDFVTGLPASEGKTVILTIVDRFSKMAHFVPLPKLPSAKETAQAVQQHVFHLHGIPADVVSNRGPQFTSSFWKEFCRLLGATVSLTSGFHPQANGQSERANQELEKALRCMASRDPLS
ncbi:hypothetical protein ACEWY4_007687 [Coilia grayii]|uniref:Gypsy retrotransposon integrase-like protein 1 n=1 Tax=Coilia grayii TaxID=363190 RepID=A0ABD1K8X1_9TELE